MDNGHGNAGRRLALPIALAVVGLLLIAVVTRAIAARRAYARAEAFCAAAAGATARDVTIRALDQSVQVRTDIEPGALVVRFTAWGFAPAAGECRMTVEADRVVAARVVRVDYN